MDTDTATFLVLPAPICGWVVTREGEKRSRFFHNRWHAIAHAHACAQGLRPSLVRVTAIDGSVEDEWAYGAQRGIRRAGPAKRESLQSAAG